MEIKKIILVLLSSIAIATGMMAQQKKLFLVAGQSNAVGMGDKNLSEKCKPGTAFEYHLTGDSIGLLQDPVGGGEPFHRASSGSAWPAFANAFFDRTKQPVVIVQAARGGSSCHAKAELENYGTWDTVGRLALFNNAVEKVKAAMKKTGLRLNGIIWSQGERDANAINNKQLTTEEYLRSLQLLVERFRAVFGKDLPFYIIQTGYYKNHPREGFGEVRKAQQSMVKMKNVFLVYAHTGEFETKGWMKDEIHYNQAALNDIGAAIAKQIVLTDQ